MITFDDQIYEAVRLLECSEQAATAMSNRLEHLIIDEFQDVNYARLCLARTIAGELAKVTVDFLIPFQFLNNPVSLPPLLVEGGFHRSLPDLGGPVSLPLSEVAAPFPELASAPFTFVASRLHPMIIAAAFRSEGIDPVFVGKRLSAVSLLEQLRPSWPWGGEQQPIGRG